MSGAASCREIRHSLGVYVLGAIDPADRSQVDEHLATCADCREELASLAGLPALLRRVPTAEAERLAVTDQADAGEEETPPGGMLPSLLARTAQARRVRRWRELAVAAAVALLALGAGAAGASVLGSSPPAPGHSTASHTWHTVSAVDSLTGATLTVKYASVPWGTMMSVRVSGIPAGTVCEFQVTDTHGHAWVVGGWRVNYRGWPFWYPASTALTDPDLGTFQVTVGGKVMASVDAA
ncbi:MAG TPA: zf-HC2 domain-containing protein [Streptosporangiaceae bacterium]|nr:zf-HC2 domain-containing protein [Streptosporangiaceae bacterium]